MTISFKYICVIINIEDSFKMRNTKLHRIFGLSLIVLALGVSIPLVVIGQINQPENPKQELIYGRGEIVYLSFEGGFFGIISNDGNHYDPVNLPSEFKVVGLRVLFIVEKLDDQASFHMWGIIVKIIFIQKL